MNLKFSKRLARCGLLAVALVIGLASCGGGGTDPEVVSAGEANAEDLLLSDSIVTTQMLNANTGEVTSLGEVVTGDRAVLAWYWAPH